MSTETNTTASYEDRFALAMAWLVMRFEQRNNFLSDDDLLDAADLHTTTDADDPEAWVNGDSADYDRLVEDLDAATAAEEDQ